MNITVWGRGLFKGENALNRCHQDGKDEKMRHLCKKVWEMFANIKINRTFALAIRKNSKQGLNR